AARSKIRGGTVLIFAPYCPRITFTHEIATGAEVYPLSHGHTGGNRATPAHYYPRYDVCAQSPLSPALRCLPRQSRRSPFALPGLLERDFFYRGRDVLALRHSLRRRPRRRDL